MTAETEIRLPQFGMGMVEATVVTWFKKQGDTVVAGEVVLEIEAAKTIEELVSPVDGVLHRVLVEEGATVPVHELLAVVAPAGTPPPEPASPTPARDQPAHPQVLADGNDEVVGARRQITPRARKLAGELGVDLESVVGTGPGGRVTDEDVRGAGEPGSPTVATPVGEESDRSGQSVPLSGMRETIARRMHASLQSTAQLTLVTTADVTDLVSYRGALGEPKPTYADFVVRASALALLQHPFLNAVLERNEICLLDDVHIGLATALDEGLVVPVIRHADRHDLVGLAAESARLTELVRSGSFSAGDVSGSTFTVTSLGGRGIDAFTPILNPPEVAVLGVGRIAEKAVRLATGVGWRQEMTLSLTIDHRVIDGSPGADFLRSVCELLAWPPALE